MSRKCWKPSMPSPLKYQAEYLRIPCEAFCGSVWYSRLCQLVDWSASLSPSVASWTELTFDPADLLSSIDAFLPQGFYIPWWYFSPQSFDCCDRPDVTFLFSLFCMAVASSWSHNSPFVCFLEISIFFKLFCKAVDTAVLHRAGPCLQAIDLRAAGYTPATGFGEKTCIGRAVPSVHAVIQHLGLHQVGFAQCSDLFIPPYCLMPQIQKPEITGKLLSPWLWCILLHYQKLFQNSGFSSKKKPTKVKPKAVRECHEFKK